MIKKKMKKYFLQGTAEELNIGDMIELDLTKDLPNGNVRHHHVECKFIPELIPLLLEQGIVEVQEVKDKKPVGNDQHTVQELIKANETLTSRIDELEDVLKKVVNLLTLPMQEKRNDAKPRRNAKAGRK